MKAVVSDSTALIILQKMDAFYLLSNIFDEVLMTEEIKNETFTSHEIPSFIKIENPTNIDTVSLLTLALDSGESSAIALALERDLQLIIDEKKGRKIAESIGVQVIGFLGVLALNVKHKKLSNIKAVEIARGAKGLGLYISNELLDVFEKRIMQSGS